MPRCRETNGVPDCLLDEYINISVRQALPTQETVQKEVMRAGKFLTLHVTPILVTLHVTSILVKH
jgi:hypothetical protein